MSFRVFRGQIRMQIFEMYTICNYKVHHTKKNNIYMMGMQCSAANITQPSAERERAPHIF